MSTSIRTIMRASRIPKPSSTFTSGFRSFATSPILKADTVTATVPKKKPVGAFRGGFFGFLLGSTVTGTAAYFYLFEEYKVANELLTEDIDALRNSIRLIETHVRTLEERLAEQQAAVVKGKK